MKFYPHLYCVIFFTLLSCKKNNVSTPNSSSKINIVEVENFGIILYDRQFALIHNDADRWSLETNLIMSEDGELTSSEVILPPVVLIKKISPHYTTGIYLGKVEIIRKDNSLIDIPKVYFELKAEKKSITFYYISSNGIEFKGDRIIGKIVIPTTKFEHLQND